MNSSHDIIVFVCILYGYLTDYYIDIYDTDKEFFNNLYKKLDEFSTIQRVKLIYDKDFDIIDKKLNVDHIIQNPGKKIDELHDFLKEVDEVINHNQESPDEIPNFKGRRWMKKNRFRDMEVDEMPIENIIRRFLKERGELDDELEVLDDNEEWEYYDEERKIWIRESDIAKKEI